MRNGMSFVRASALLIGLWAVPASAQQFGVAGFGGNAGFVGNGFNAGFTNLGATGFGFNGLGYNGLGYNGFGYNNYYNRGYNYNVPQTYNNMGGLMNSIRTQTGRGNSYRYGYATGGRRR